MKKIFILLLFISGACYSQHFPYNYEYRPMREARVAGWFDSTITVPHGTTPSLRGGGAITGGALFYKTGDSSLYRWSGWNWAKVGAYDTSFAFSSSLTTNTRLQKIVDSLNAAGWGTSTTYTASNGTYLDGTVIKLGTNPLVENTAIPGGLFNFSINNTDSLILSARKITQIGDANSVSNGTNITVDNANKLIFLDSRGTGQTVIGDVFGGGNVTYLGVNDGDKLIELHAEKTSMTGNFYQKVTTDAGGTLTLGTSTVYVFGGTTTTWTLPAVSGTSGLTYYIKNRGSGNITLNAAAAANEIYSTSAVNTITITPGTAIILISDGTYFMVN